MRAKLANSALSSSWGIKLSEQREVRRADMLVEPLDPGVGDVLIDQLRLGPSWTYADPTQLAAERKRVMGALRALGEEGKVQFVEPDDPRLST